VSLFTTSRASYGELLRRNEDLTALVTSLHDIERAEETRAQADSLSARLNRWWLRGPSPTGLLTALLGHAAHTPTVRLVADPRIAAPLQRAVDRLPSYFSRTSSSSASNALSSSASSSPLLLSGASPAGALRVPAAAGDEVALPTSGPSLAAGVTAGVVLLITQVQPNGVVTRRAMSIAMAGCAAAGFGVYAARRLLQLMSGAATLSRGPRRYDAKHEYECRVQELKFRYEKMARTLRALRSDARVMSHQREELYDLTALLARHDSLVRHAFLAMGIRPADADAILAPLRAQLRAFGSRSDSRRSDLTRTRGADDAESEDGAGNGPELVRSAVGRLSDGRSVVVSVGEQQVRGVAAKGTLPQTEIVLRGAGNVSERKIRRMQEAVSRIFVEDDEHGGSPDANAFENAATPPMLLPPRRRRANDSADDGEDDGEADDDDDESFYSADEDDFVRRNAPFESGVDSATRSETFTEDDESAKPAHDLRAHVLQQQARSALTPPQSRRRPTRHTPASPVPESDVPGFYRWAPADKAVAAQTPRQRDARLSTLYDVAVGAGDSVFVYKFRHAESGVADVTHYRAQVYWLRHAFEALGAPENDAARRELMQLSEQLAVSLLSDVLGDRGASDSFQAALRDLMTWVGANAEQARADASRLKCRYLNAYDAFLEWILLDAFADLANVPSALSGWMPEAGKRALVVRQLDAKIAAARAASNEFQCRYYTALKALTPHLVVGFTSSNKQVIAVFAALQRIVLERLYKPLFAIELKAVRDERQLVTRVVDITRAALIEIREAVDRASSSS
jgi:hypothetical protein